MDGIRHTIQGFQQTAQDISCALSKYSADTLAELGVKSSDVEGAKPLTEFSVEKLRTLMDGIQSFTMRFITPEPSAASRALPGGVSVDEKHQALQKKGEDIFSHLQTTSKLLDGHVSDISQVLGSFEEAATLILQLSRDIGELGDSLASLNSSVPRATEDFASEAMMGGAVGGIDEPLTEVVFPYASPAPTDRRERAGFLTPGFSPVLLSVRTEMSPALKGSLKSITGGNFPATPGTTRIMLDSGFEIEVEISSNKTRDTSITIRNPEGTSIGTISIGFSLSKKPNKDGGKVVSVLTVDPQRCYYESITNKGLSKLAKLDTIHPILELFPDSIIERIRVFDAGGRMPKDPFVRLENAPFILAENPLAPDAMIDVPLRLLSRLDRAFAELTGIPKGRQLLSELSSSYSSSHLQLEFSRNFMEYRADSDRLYVDPKHSMESPYLGVIKLSDTEYKVVSQLPKFETIVAHELLHALHHKTEGRDADHLYGDRDQIQEEDYTIRGLVSGLDPSATGVSTALCESDILKDFGLPIRLQHSYDESLVGNTFDKSDMIRLFGADFEARFFR